MTEREFEQLYGRKPKKRVRYKIYWGRIFIALLILVLIIYLIVKAVSGLISIIKKTGGDDSSSMAAAVSQAQSAQADSGKKSKDEKQEDTVSDKIDAGALTVCIDAGHGGYDAGTTDMTGLRQEKTDTLEAALKIKAELEKMGVTVIMTREDDTALEHAERCAIANDAKADMFVSVHRNSSDRDYQGVEVWVNNAKPEYDVKLAENILSGLREVGISEDRGVQYGYVGNSTVNYYVNADTVMPSCIIELGFISSDFDNQLFDEHLDEYAKAAAKAIVRTSKEIGLIDGSGKRTDPEQLISKEKEINGGAEDEDSQADESQGDDYNENGGQTEGEVYNTQENEAYDPSQDTDQYTDETAYY